MNFLTSLSDKVKAKVESANCWTYTDLKDDIDYNITWSTTLTSWPNKVTNMWGLFGILYPGKKSNINYAKDQIKI